MLLIRAYEEKSVALQQGGAAGICTSIGQEACAVGVMDALDAHDRILTNRRSGDHLIAQGAEPRRLRVCPDVASACDALVSTHSHNALEWDQHRSEFFDGRV